ncbi:ABC transporter permease [Mollicutes bacterium LVI A0078]|nr:ABC transporter permease [Mollicutes bacterium LVI A0075]WOO91035.1 ABC transporter permease [Mollicutes bacterium LVI A0078]
MIEFKLGLRNFKRDITIYSFMVVSSAVFIALIVGFQSTIDSGSLGEMLSADNLSSMKQLFKIILIAIAVVQYIILVFFMNGYYRILNKKRIRELALYKIIGYTRGSIKKILLTEGLLLFVISLPFSLVFAVVLNQTIVGFVNYYLNLDLILTASISMSSFWYSNLVFLIVICVNGFKTYRNVLSVDLEEVLNESSIQKNIVFAPKYYVFVNLIIGLILVTLMSYLSTQVMYTFRFGIIILAIFYAIGLFLIINAIAKGYRYLISEESKRKNFNRLLAAESNFQLNKSRLITLSSIILIMMTIGSLLLSQAITITLNQSIGDSDYYFRTYEYNITNTLDGTSWVNADDPEDDAYTYINLYPIEIANEIGIAKDPKPYQIEVSPDSGYQVGDKVQLITSEQSFDFTVSMTINQNAETPIAFIPIKDIEGLDTFKNYNNTYIKMQILNNEVEQGDLNQTQITKYDYAKAGADYSTPLISLDDYNKYLNLIDKDSVELDTNQIIIDGNIEEDTSQYDVIKHSHQGLNAIIVPNSTIECFDYEKDFISKTSTKYYKAINEDTREDISKQLLDIDDRMYGIIDVNRDRQDMLGDTAFILLVALYLAIIFIITNFTIITINILSHGIENKQLYVKLEQMGISKKEKSHYIGTFISTISTWPLVIGVISGIIATNFAIKLVLNDRGINFSSNITLLLILVLYIFIYIMFIAIIKYVYTKIIS